MEKIYDLIIIGSGPAGLAAAIYAQRARLDTLVIEKDMASGGQVLTTYEVDNYPGFPGINGFDLGTKFREHAEGLGARFITDQVERVEEEGGYLLQAAELKGHGREKKTVKEVVCREGSYRTRAVLIATGAHHQKLGAPGEEELSGMGVSYCATCDGAFFRNKEVAVVGGGDVALEDAIFLSRMCTKVYLIHRRDEFRGAKSLQETVFEQGNIEILWDTVVEEIQGSARVEGLKVKNKKTGKESVLSVQGVFIAVGIRPNSQVFDGLVEMEQGYIKAGEDTKTSVPGIFAAGDVRTKPLRQIVTAAADGANGVTAVERYLAEG
ncbi:MAG: thioredoxin-disulfide reductase [Hungatella sp.]|jgi:thioredoxin reductase (NADPH)|nr:thioredoxin-disulfide reductase [Hungatella sp.]